VTPFPAYQFFPAMRRCPVCSETIVSTTPLSKEFMRGRLNQMGLTCYCVGCNNRFRAIGKLHFSAVAWAGVIGRWLWWQMAELESTTPAAEL
jgi:hypothetical protein